MDHKKKKHKKSMSATIRDLRESLREERIKNDSLRNKSWRFERQYEKIFELLPKKYYEVAFKAKSQANTILEYKKCVLGIHPKIVVDEIKSECQNFELLSIKETR